MIVSKEYNSDLIFFIDSIRKKLYESVKDINIQFVNISFNIPVTSDFLYKYKLNKKFDFIADLKDWNDVDVNIHYNGCKIKPDGYYLRPDDWVEPHLLDVLQECIKQDTYKPDITHLEKFNIRRERRHKLERIK